MSSAHTNEQASRKSLRLWPGVAALVVQWLGWFVLPLLVPGASVYGVTSALLATVVIIVWWLFFSRAPWLERVAAIALMPLAVIVTKRLVHPSIAGAMMGF